MSMDKKRDKKDSLTEAYLAGRQSTDSTTNSIGGAAVGASVGYLLSGIGAPGQPEIKPISDPGLINALMQTAMTQTLEAKGPDGQQLTGQALLDAYNTNLGGVLQTAFNTVGERGQRAVQAQVDYRQSEAAHEKNFAMGGGALGLIIALAMAARSNKSAAGRWQRLQNESADKIRDKEKLPPAR